MKNIVIVLLSTLLIAGCATSESTSTGTTHYAATAEDSVQILFEKPARKYEVLGQVSGRGGELSSQTDIYDAMKRDAAKLGADAILVRSDVQKEDGTFWKKGSGLAIRWIK